MRANCPICAIIFASDGVTAMTKFINKDREKVIAELEAIQKTRLLPIEGRTLFADAHGAPYLILGGSSTWHAIRPSIVERLRGGENGFLVVTKKYRSRMDVCLGPLAAFMSNLHHLKTNQQGQVQFHILVEEDGLSVAEFPEFHLNKVKEIPLSGALAERRKIIDKIVSLELEHDGEVSHSDIQAKLILLGSYLGFRTFTPDRAKESALGVLGELCSEKVVPEGFFAPQLISTIKYIDVIWFDDEGFPTHGFEVEHTTDVTKGMLRLYQASKLRIKMFIIAEEGSRNRFERESAKSPFSKIKDSYIFKNYRELDEFFNSVKRFSQLQKEFLQEKE